MSDGDVAFGLEGFSGQVPIFPLPDIVLYPCTLLPLHIFEPRYRAMVEAALAGEGLIAMVRLRPGWERTYYENPEVASVCCVGKMIEVYPHADGRYDVVLCGVRRARIDGFVAADRPFRTAEVTLLPDRPIEPAAEAAAAKLERALLTRVKSLPGELLKHRNLALALKKLGAPLGAITDLVADSLRVRSSFKQKLLEEACPIARARLLVRLIDVELGAVAARGSGAPFPAEPSLN